MSFCPLLSSSERSPRSVSATRSQHQSGKGLWVGGTLPLGYEMKDGKIAIVEEEAELVRSIFRRYLELGSVNELLRDLKERTSEPKADCSPPESPAAASRSAVVRCTTCSAITSISVRSNTRMRSCLGCSHRSW